MTGRDEGLAGLACRCDQHEEGRRIWALPDLRRGQRWTVVQKGPTTVEARSGGGEGVRWWGMKRAQVFACGREIIEQIFSSL